MARRWTPQRFVTLRRIRVIACIAATSIALAGSFAFTARKSVALNINGQTTQVTTYAMTATRLLEEQGVDIKTHDIVTTSSGDQLANHAVVTVQSAYQTTINIDGTAVPFWTVATSADQLLGFFEENQNNAAKITVDIKNVYNQLTGGLVINQSGPVTVIADGKSSVAPNGKLPAASILDSKGIVLNKEDRVSVEKDSDETILRVRRVTHGEETRTSVIPFSTQTIIDLNNQLQSSCNGAQIGVLTVDYTGNYSTEDYATQAFNAWGIGDATNNNGVLILLVMESPIYEDGDYYVTYGDGFRNTTLESQASALAQTMEGDFVNRDYSDAVITCANNVADTIASVYGVNLNNGSYDDGSYDDGSYAQPDDAPRHL